MATMILFLSGDLAMLVCECGKVDLSRRINEVDESFLCML